METIKILQVNVTLNSGSTGRIAEDIGKKIQALGWESYIAYGRASTPSSSHAIKIGGRLDHAIHGLASRLLDRHGLASAGATRKLIEEVRQLRPDVIHLHNFHGYYLNYPLLFTALRELGIPVVWTVHDCWYFTGHCAYFDMVRCEKWRTGCHHCPQKTTYPASYLLDRSRLNWLDKKTYFNLPEKMVLVPVSHWLEGLLHESFLGKYPIQMIYNGIDTEAFQPCPAAPVRKKYNWPEQEKILLGVASVWSPRKGLKDFVALARLLPPGYRIVLVGLPEAQQKDLPENITAIARTESIHALAELYSAADVVLNLSYEETFGLTSAEGFACGTPGVAYDRTASPELFVPEVGKVVPAGDLEALKRAIEEITARDKSFYAANCRAHAIAKFRKEDCFQEYVDLYRKILEI